MNNNTKPISNSYLTVIQSPWFALFWLSAMTLSYFYLDRPIAIFFHQFKDSYLNIAAECLTHLGRGVYYVFGFAIAFLVSRYVFRNAKWTRIIGLLFCAIAIPGVVTDILKFIFSRSRPTLFFHQDLYGFYFFHAKNVFHSFPSGHATTIAGLMMAIGLIWNKGWFWLVLLTALVCFSRVVLTAHFLSDVMMGFYVGSIVTLWLFEQFGSRTAGEIDRHS